MPATHPNRRERVTRKTNGKITAPANASQTRVTLGVKNRPAPENALSPANRTIGSACISRGKFDRGIAGVSWHRK